MGRPRAGHGFTIHKGLHLIADDFGNWVPAGVAHSWPRCKRCRRPTQHEFGAGLCNSCYYHHALPAGTFWQHDKEQFFPYNIGSRMQANICKIAERFKHRKEPEREASGFGSCIGLTLELIRPHLPRLFQKT